MNIQDLNNLDFENIGSWPLPKQFALIAVAVVLLLGSGYWFDTQVVLEQREDAIKKEEVLRKDFEKGQGEAADLEIYQKQSIELEKSISVMLSQLPHKAEVEALLMDISQAGHATGLEFELFRPGAPVSQEFQDLPIEIKVVGTYHQFGQFTSNIAALSRIVTLHDVSLEFGTGKNDKLTMDVFAKIYYYQDEGSTKGAAAQGRHP